MSLFSVIYTMIMKQYHIDKGELGGLYNTFMLGSSLLTIITVINTSVTAYQTFWKYYFSIYEMLIIIFCFAVLSLWFMHAILLPSLSIYNARHSYELHNNPIKKDINEILLRLEMIEQNQKEQHNNDKHN